MLYNQWLRNNKQHQALLSLTIAPCRQICFKAKPNKFQLMQSDKFCSVPSGEELSVLLPCRGQRASSVHQNDVNLCEGGTTLLDFL